MMDLKFHNQIMASREELLTNVTETFNKTIRPLYKDDFMKPMADPTLIMVTACSGEAYDFAFRVFEKILKEEREANNARFD